MSQQYPGLLSFQNGQTVELDGVLYKMATVTVDGEEVEDEIRPGDTYFARRNGGPRILTANRIDKELGCIFPEENAYPYDLHECMKVVVVREASEDDRNAFTGPSADELRAMFAQPFVYESLESRQSRSIVFRDWDEHRDHEMVAREGAELADGTWILEGYIPAIAGKVEVEYHPEHRTGSFTWTYVSPQPATT